jgi:hypothetical protein
MADVIRFVPKNERERARLIREARARYDSIFPPAHPIREQPLKAQITHAGSGANVHRSEVDLLSCHEQIVTTSDFADISMQSCLVGAPQLAGWMKQHPAERLAAWRCVIGQPDGRGA